jgi:heptosyltransferase-3
LNKPNFNKKVLRILVFRIGELGDTLIALPALRAIRKAFPLAHIALLGNVDARRRHVTPQQILSAPGLIDEWISYSSDYQGAFAKRARQIAKDRLRLVGKLRRGRYDKLVYLAPRFRSPRDVRRDLLFFRLAGITEVIGQYGFSPLPLPSGAPLQRVEHEADHLLHRLSLGGIPVPAAGAVAFALDLTEEEEKTASRWWRENVPALEAGPAIAFGPGSKWPSKVWPVERFLEVGQQLIVKRNVFPIIFGGPEDRDLGNRLLSAWGRGANTAGELSVRHAAAALARCPIYVGNDTGTMHLAAAVKTICVVTMSAQDWPGRWDPYGAGHIVLRRQVPCAGCMLNVCDIEGMRCLKEITVEDVVDACESALRAQSEGQTAESEGPIVNCSLPAFNS